MPIRGDFGKLRGLIGRMREATSGSLTRSEGRLMQEALAATREEVAECFLYQRDPSGNAWLARLTIYGDERDTNPLLYDLLSSMEFDVEDGKTRVSNRKHYAVFHLRSYKRRPARVFLPTRSAPGKLFDRVKLGAVRAVRALFRL